MTKIVAIVQARMSSTRFPGKVLETIGDTPAIVFMVERVRRAETVDHVIVATSVADSDTPLADVLDAHGIDVFRGDLDDVLVRYADAARATDADIIVRLTGDCPLADPQIVDDVVGTLIEAGCDYASNVDPPTYADGFDVECFTRQALDQADREAVRPEHREHVTLWMRSDARLDRRSVQGVVDSSRIRLTVDYPDDLMAVREIVGLLKNKPDFDYFDVLRCIEQNRAVMDLNRHPRNEALSTSGER